MLFNYLLYRSAICPLDRIRADMARISSADLTGKIHVCGNNELAKLADALRVLQINMKLPVGQIKEAAVVLHHGTSEIEQGNTNLSSRAEAQASALEETASSMEELIHPFLSLAAGRAQGISFDLVKKSIRNALCFGLYVDEKQIGYARAISDRQRTWRFLNRTYKKSEKSCQT